MPIQNFLFQETSPAAPGTAASSQPVAGSNAANIPAGVCGLFDDYEAVNVVADLKGATGGTLDVYAQISPDGGVNWYDVIHFPTQTSGGPAAFYDAPMSNSTTTTFAVVVGKNLTPALVQSATAGVVNGAFTDRMRLVMVAGSGTSAGAPVVVRVTAQRSRLREAGGD